MKYLIFILTILFVSIDLYTQVPEIKWTPVGIGGGGGQFSPAVSPLDSKIMFVSCDMGGVYKTDDNGESWSMINFRQLRSSTALPTVFHPTNKDIMWDDNRNKLKRTTDGGSTWNTVWEMPERPADIVCVSSDNHELTMLIALGEEGLYRSDNGLQFFKVDGIPEAYYISENKKIVVASKSRAWYSTDEGNTFTEFASMPHMDNPGGVIDIAATRLAVYVLEETKLWETLDYGHRWRLVAKAEDYDRGDFRFVTAELNKDYVWLTTSGGGKYQPTALLSTEHGDNYKPVFFCNDSWDDTRNLESGWLSLDFNCGWGGAAIGFCIAPSKPEIALWTDYGRTLRTTNAGLSWEALYTKYADDGEPAEGKLWTSRGLEVTSSWDIFIPDNDNSFINVAYTDIGGAYSSDGGVKWRSTFDGGIPWQWHNTTYDFAYDSDNNILWGAFSGRHDIPGGWSANYWENEGHGGVAFSTDNGMHWTPLTENGLIDKPVTSIAVDFTSPAGNRRLYAAVWSDGVWRSEDGGKSWERITNGLDCGDGSQSNDGPNTHVVDVQVNSEGTVYALKTKYLRNNYVIKNDAGLWKSTNHGDSWEFISGTVQECPPRPNIDLNNEHSWADAISFTLDENDHNHIFVGAQNATNGKVQGGLYETTDGGTTWKRIHQNYASFRVTISKYHKDRLYLAGTGEGILISEDNGATWNVFENFPFANPTRVTEDPVNPNVLWVNTFGGGVWKGELQNQTAVNENIYNNPILISPNPARDYVDITMPEGTGTDRTLKDAVRVYDVLGVCVLEHTAGGGHVRIDVSKLAAGVYFVRIGSEVYRFVKL